MIDDPPPGMKSEADLVGWLLDDLDGDGCCGGGQSEAAVPLGFGYVLPSALKLDLDAFGPVDEELGDICVDQPSLGKRVIEPLQLGALRVGVAARAERDVIDPAQASLLALEPSVDDRPTIEIQPFARHLERWPPSDLNAQQPHEKVARCREVVDMDIDVIELHGYLRFFGGASARRDVMSIPARGAQGDEKLVQVLEGLGHPTLHPGDGTVESCLRGIEFRSKGRRGRIFFPIKRLMMILIR